MKRILAVVLTPLVAIAAAIAVPNIASGAPSQLPDAAYQHNVCGPPAAGTARCHARVVDADGGAPGRAPTPKVSPSPAGLVLKDIQTAYGFAPGNGGAGKTIAIVDAYDNPTALQDVATFDKAMGLGPCGCTMTKVNQRGGTTPPSPDQGWALEIALDVQWAHAIAPNANILLVEADSNSYTDLFAAVDYAATAGHADYISMSWGSNEFGTESSYDSHFNVAGVSYFVSAGDAGLPAEYPSSSPKVISVGGTKLTFTDSSKSTLSSETAWSSGGGGCSTYETKSASQPQASQCAANVRATPDISLDADPASGVSVYMGSTYPGAPGWFTVGGTSASSPMIAGRAALTGGPVTAATIYGLAATSIRDITVGNNGSSCRTGYDLCSGRGSWADNASTVPSTTTTTTAAPTQTSVHVSSVAYQSSGAGFTVTITVLDNLNKPVPNASVQVQVKRANATVSSTPTTGTTNASGQTAFTVASASKGTYTTKVTSISGIGTLTWNGSTPSNSYKK